MSFELDIRAVAHRVQSRIGVRLAPGDRLIEGGNFPVLRPCDFEDGQGFIIALARTPRQLVASFHLDRYARRLVRVMWESEEASRLALASMVEATRVTTASVVLEANGDPYDPGAVSATPWRTFTIEVTRQLLGKVTKKIVEDEATEAASLCLALALSLIPVEEVETLGTLHTGLPEGAKMSVEVNRYERSPVNRAACLAHFGATCQGCGFAFSNFYGQIAEGYIEVHHLTPVSEMGEGYVVNPMEDLVPLCGNCHAVVHRREPPLAIDELRELIVSQKLRRHSVL